MTAQESERLARVIDRIFVELGRRGGGELVHSGDTAKDYADTLRILFAIRKENAQ